MQNPPPFIVTVIDRPSHATTLGDVIVGSLGLAGALLVGAMLLGVVVAGALILWRRLHPPESGRLPPVTPATPLHPPSSPAR